MSASVASRILLLTTIGLTAAALGGCKTIGSTDTTGSISAGPQQRTEADWRRESEALGERFRANPRDPDVAIRLAQALRATGQRAQAAAVLETAALHNPENRALLGAFGRALADFRWGDQADVIFLGKLTGPTKEGIGHLGGYHYNLDVLKVEQARITYVAQRPKRFSAH